MTADAEALPEAPIEPRYDPGVSHLTDAKRAIADIERHEAGVEAARLRRDRAIHGLRDDGRNPPAIARELGLSVSLVRLVLRLPRPAAPPKH